MCSSGPVIYGYHLSKYPSKEEFLKCSSKYRFRKDDTILKKKKNITALCA
jgi:hypothetical protein